MFLNNPLCFFFIPRLCSLLHYSISFDVPRRHIKILFSSIVVILFLYTQLFYLSKLIFSPSLSPLQVLKFKFQNIKVFFNFFSTFFPFFLFLFVGFFFYIFTCFSIFILFLFHSILFFSTSFFIFYFCMDFCLLKEVGLLFPLFFSMMIKSEFSYISVQILEKKFLGQR